MKSTTTWKLVAIFFVVAVASVLAVCGFQVGIYDVLPWANAVPLAIDLKGGISAVYQAADPKLTGFDEKIAGAVELIRARLYEAGYAEASVALEGSDRIRVELPPVENPDSILALIGATAKLELLDPDGAAILVGERVASAKAAQSQGGAPAVSLELDAQAKDAFAEATERLAGQSVEVLLDGVPISRQSISVPVLDGKWAIEGFSTYQEAKDFALLIRSGSLPLEINEIQARAVSAALGGRALNNSLLAGAVAVALALIFIAALYRLPGLIADFALAAYMLIILLFLAVMPGIRLTLPGIAGIVLGAAMAVNANIVILERIKDELRMGKTVRMAVSSGFSKAFSVMVGLNITTAVAVIVLWIFAPGTIKSFAMTLFVSIVASMITIIFLTRYLLIKLGEFTGNNKKLYGVRAKV